MDRKANLKFPLVLKKIREDRNLTMRKVVDMTGYAPSYICDLEKGNRKPTMQVVETFINKLNLTEIECHLLLVAYTHDRLEIPADLGKYLVENDLIDSLYALKELDKDGANIKKLVEDLKSQKVKR